MKEGVKIINNYKNYNSGTEHLDVIAFVSGHRNFIWLISKSDPASLWPLECPVQVSDHLPVQVSHKQRLLCQSKLSTVSCLLLGPTRTVREQSPRNI